MVMERLGVWGEAAIQFQALYKGKYQAKKSYTYDHLFFFISLSQTGENKQSI